MTLILAMSKDEGMYLGVDFRVTIGRSARIVDDGEVKFLHVKWPPLEGGPEGFLAYTGLARMKDGTPTGTWIRETLRGEAEVFDVAMKHLRDRLDRDVATQRAGLIINIFALHQGKRYFGGLSNMEWADTSRTRVQLARSFGYTLEELTTRAWFANGSGARTVVADGHATLLQAQIDRRPNKIQDHMNLLAAINRRVAAKDPTVSPFSHVTFIPKDPKIDSPQSRTFTRRGESVPFTMPFLLCGIDLSLMAKQAADALAAVDSGQPYPDPDIDEVNRSLQRRP